MGLIDIVIAWYLSYLRVINWKMMIPYCVVDPHQYWVVPSGTKSLPIPLLPYRHKPTYKRVCSMNNLGINDKMYSNFIVSGR